MTMREGEQNPIRAGSLWAASSGHSEKRKVIVSCCTTFDIQYTIHIIMFITIQFLMAVYVCKFIFPFRELKNDQMRVKGQEALIVDMVSQNNSLQNSISSVSVNYWFWCVFTVKYKN